MGLKTVKWVNEVPPRVGGTGHMTKLARIAKKLQDNPNRWAEVGSAQTYAQAHTLSSRLRGAGLQVSIRRAGGGWTKIYARYNSSPAKNSSSKKKTVAAKKSSKK